jgi:hypothetical protein
VVTVNRAAGISLQSTGTLFTNLLDSTLKASRFRRSSFLIHGVNFRGTGNRCICFITTTYAAAVADLATESDSKFHRNPPAPQTCKGPEALDLGNEQTISRIGRGRNSVRAPSPRLRLNTIIVQALRTRNRTKPGPESTHSFAWRGNNHEFCFLLMFGV